MTDTRPRTSAPTAPSSPSALSSPAAPSVPSAPAAGPAAAHLSGPGLFTVLLGAALPLIDFFIVNVALPSIEHDLAAGPPCWS